MSRAMLLHSGLDESLWAEAVATAVYIRNRSPTKIIEDATPYEVFTGTKPSVKHFRVFGSVAVALDKTAHRKFQPKGNEYKMVGYSLTSKAYRLYDDKRRIVVEKSDVMFIETANIDTEETIDMAEFCENKNKDEANTYKENQEKFEESSSEDEFLGFDDSPIRKECVNNDYTNVKEKVVKVGIERPKTVRTGRPGRPKKIKNVLNALNNEFDVKIPQTVEEAEKSDLSSEWKKSMQNEYDALMANNTWSLVKLPEDKKAIGSKWVFAVKRNKDGNIEKFKSRLVAKGCSQQFGVDYTETFSPVIRYETIRMVLGLAAEKKMYLHQMDVCTAYLNSDLSEEVYMKQPQNFVSKSHPDYVLKLNKAIYGLKQAGREWNAKLGEVLHEFGFNPCKNDPCLFKMTIEGRLCLVAVYVDDLIIGCEDKTIMMKVKGYISESFDCIDKGPINLFLGMQIERDGEVGTISVHQSNYIRELLKQHNMENCRSASTPLDAGFQMICKDKNCIQVERKSYQSSIGGLMYLAMCTRPDILHSVAKLAQFNMNPHKEHEAGIRHVLRYLASTINLKLVYKYTGKMVEGYADADWGSNALDRKSYSGYVFLIGGSAFSWSSKKQNCVALSSTEAEYIAMSTAAKEAAYLKSLLVEINVHDQQHPIVMYGDNLSAQQLARNPVYHSRSKHIDIRYHFVRELVCNNVIELRYMPTDQMIADVLTKNLSKLKHENFVKFLGLI